MTVSDSPLLFFTAPERLTHSAFFYLFLNLSLFIRIIQKLARLFVYKANENRVDNPVGLW